MSRKISHSILTTLAGERKRGFAYADVNLAIDLVERLAHPVSTVRDIDHK